MALGVHALVGAVPVQAAGAVGDAVKHGTLRVGMGPIYIPFEMTNERGQIIGFEVGLLRAMTKSMGIKLELVSTSYSGIAPALLTGKLDIVGLGVTLAQEHNLRLNFSKPSIVVGQILLVCKELKGRTKSYKDLNDLQCNIASKIGITGETAVHKLINRAKHRGFDNESEAMMDVVNGKADVFTYDSSYNVVAVSKFGVGKLVYLDQPFIYKSLTFGLKKDDYDSTSLINSFLHQIREDGTYQRIHDERSKNTEWLKKME